MTTKRPSKSSKANSATPAPGRPRLRPPAPWKRRARPLTAAPPDKCFWVHYGPVLKDLRELRDALGRHISDSQFAHHVGPDHNDFANWVDHVLAENHCAQALRRAHSVKDALRAVEAALRDR